MIQFGFVAPVSGALNLVPYLTLRALWKAGDKGLGLRGFGG